jgi:hypothetical protein
MAGSGRLYRRSLSERLQEFDSAGQFQAELFVVQQPIFEVFLLFRGEFPEGAAGQQPGQV